MAKFIVLLVSTALSISSIMAQPQRSVDENNPSKFAADIYKTATKKTPGNVIISPFSIRAALSLVAEGAEEGTFDDLQKNLYLPKTKQAIADNYKSTFQSLVKTGNSAVTLDVANKIYVQEGYTIKPSYKTVAVESFGSEVEAANFADNVKSAKTINTWVEQKTHDKIKDLISSDSLDADSRLVIVSAIYFKGQWANKFNKDLTKKDEFWVSANESKQVDYMIQKNDFYYGQFPQLDATILKLNYNDSDISFWIVLPNQREGLAALETKLETVNWNELNDNLFKTEVNVKIPKFKIESEFKLKEALEELHLGGIFSNGANFRGLLDTNEPLAVADVVHKAFIEVNEEGAEAAAATGVVFHTKSAVFRLHSEYFTADHPFYFAITIRNQPDENEERKFAPLFLGRQTDFV